MIRELKYVNSMGEEVVFKGDLSWKFNDTDIFNIALDYNTIGNSITSFESNTRKFSLAAIMRGGSTEERNRFIDVVSYDSYVLQPGTLYAGDSYMNCYISSVEFSAWYYSDASINADITIVSDTPYWVRKVSQTLTPSAESTAFGLDYPYDYPYDYMASSDNSSILTNPFMLPAIADITFGGPCVSPYVIIGNNRYQVDATAEKGQLIIIKGMGTKDIVLRGVTGEEQSLFANGLREDGANVFAQIPVGKNSIAWSGAYSVVVDMYEKRRSPFWT